ncbi:hypothetical protein [Geodermatophilus sp. DSM 44513]|uniref:hypothetical protein n=1 Tax=Geodermatophilus sp. DSM 44513 TaxID=1528104 RepID=UPI001412F027|nr:hypothetical protein [Geodermatophilus sp. DSM 44513]WNV74125.1 hypothetical protein RTG05_14130 [Geodermatophilus sp. DSM 44513]
MLQAQTSCSDAPALFDLLARPVDATGDDREFLEWLGEGYGPDSFDAATTDEMLAPYDRHTRGRRRP